MLRRVVSADKANCDALLIRDIRKNISTILRLVGSGQVGGTTSHQLTSYNRPRGQKMCHNRTTATMPQT
jgi:hypothetical protein